MAAAADVYARSNRSAQLRTFTFRRDLPPPLPFPLLARYLRHAAPFVLWPFRTRRTRDIHMLPQTRNVRKATEAPSQALSHNLQLVLLENIPRPRPPRVLPAFFAALQLKTP